MQTQHGRLFLLCQSSHDTSRPCSLRKSPQIMSCKLEQKKKPGWFLTETYIDIHDHKLKGNIDKLAVPKNDIILQGIYDMHFNTIRKQSLEKTQLLGPDAGKSL